MARANGPHTSCFIIIRLYDDAFVHILRGTGEEREEEEGEGGVGRGRGSA